VDDEAICALVTRLARPHASGGQVIERSMMLAEGTDFPAIMAWVVAHGGKPEQTPPAASRRGLHGPMGNGGGAEPGTPLRFVLPAGALA
jgi:hypothetical protein